MKSEYAQNRLAPGIARSAGFEDPFAAAAAARLRHHDRHQGWSGDVLRAEEGSLYPALHRMEEAGWIRAEWIMKDTGRRARMYELTAAGKKQLDAEESRWQAVTSAVNRVLRTA
jgi:DNA-binding MarR family transcriptional regulator